MIRIFECPNNHPERFNQPNLRIDQYNKIKSKITWLLVRDTPDEVTLSRAIPLYPIYT